MVIARLRNSRRKSPSPPVCVSLDLFQRSDGWLYRPLAATGEGAANYDATGEGATGERAAKYDETGEGAAKHDPSARREAAGAQARAGPG